MRGRKKSEPQEEGSPAWMNTYGDMVTLLLTFFVLLFSFSTIDAQKWEQIVSALSGSPFIAVQSLDLGDISVTGETSSMLETAPPTATPVGQEETSAQTDWRTRSAPVDEDIFLSFNQLYEKIKNHIEENNLGYILSVYRPDEYTILLRMTDSAFFDSGSANLKKDVKTVLKDICNIIETYTDLMKIIRVEGHTDNVPMHNANFTDNLELSQARSGNVVRYILTVSDIDPSLLSATGFSEYQPIADNNTEEGRTKNRRVEVVIESILQ